MAKKRTSKAEIGSPPSVSADKAIEILRRQIRSAQEYLDSHQLPDNEYAAWKALTENYLVMAFGSDSPNVRRVMDVGKYGSFPMDASESWRENHRVESITKQMRILESLVELLQVQKEASASPSSEELPKSQSNRVFLVHGHDQSVLHETARFLESLGLEAIILREQPSEGRTIIEKFIDYSDVAYAVVLLTPDDRGGVTDAEFTEQTPRARQNVIFELGFFVGKLGRRSVAALYVDGVEVPSDYSGVVFIPFDESGGWRLFLAKELKAAGIEIDMNRAT